jgi:hypothetical protein
MAIGRGNEKGWQMAQTRRRDQLQKDAAVKRRGLTAKVQTKNHRQEHLPVVLSRDAQGILNAFAGGGLSRQVVSARGFGIGAR